MECVLVGTKSVFLVAYQLAALHPGFFLWLYIVSQYHDPFGEGVYYRGSFVVDHCAIVIRTVAMYSGHTLSSSNGVCCIE